jgi:hypothetical protein
VAPFAYKILAGSSTLIERTHSTMFNLFFFIFILKCWISPSYLGHLGVVEALLSAGANSEPAQLREMHDAMATSPPRLRHRLAREEALYRSKWSPIEAARRRGQTQVVKLLNAKGGGGRREYIPPLILAAGRGDERRVGELLAMPQYGRHVDQCAADDESGCTALHAAAANGHSGVSCVCLSIFSSFVTRGEF